jgi:hypothetical protein
MLNSSKVLFLLVYLYFSLLMPFMVYIYRVKYYIYIYNYIYICVNVCEHIYIHMKIMLCIFKCIYICLYLYGSISYIYTLVPNTKVYIYIYICTYKQKYENISCIFFYQFPMM